MRYVVLLAFAALLAAAILLWQAPAVLIGCLYGAGSLLAFAVYAKDKAAAKAGRWRTPESTLLVLALACGWPGALLAQQWLRHKTNKPGFLARFWLAVLLNVGVFAWLAGARQLLRF
jgi:uncharacterized membrane protein YsdA (DUF1294 family)